MSVRLLRLHRYPVLSLLRLEEALLRNSLENWFVVNDGTPAPAIVLGISGKPVELVQLESANAADVPLIKRFTGGGTVVVDNDTIFTALIMSGSSIPDVPCYPRPIMEWTEQLYKPVFDRHGPFTLREHDYVFGERKCGGNAQAITKNRWLHHTSFLWDFSAELMALLKHPSRAPEYRAGRSHLDFMCSLKEFVPCRKALVESMCSRLEEAGFEVQEATLDEASQALERSRICGTRVLDTKALILEQPSLQQQKPSVSAPTLAVGA